MNSNLNEGSSEISREEKKKDKPSLVEKIVETIHQDIVDVLEAIKETEKS